MKMIPRPHDLLVLADDADVQADLAAEQEALDAALASARMVVVRRAAARGEWVPVGIRGRAREQRFAGWLRRGDVAKVVAPEALRVTDGGSSLPALRALWLLQERWATFQLAWGPVGSVGFALASGADVVTESSDLDVVLRAPVPLTAATAGRMAEGCEVLPCRVDAQVMTPLGGVALGELAAGSGPVMLRADAGVRLVESPWLEAVAR